MVRTTKWEIIAIKKIGFTLLSRERGLPCRVVPSGEEPEAVRRRSSEETV